MAVDSRQKRFNMMAFGDGAIIHVQSEADAGGIEADDRAQLLGLYGGIALSPGAVISVQASLIGPGGRLVR